MTDNSQNDAPLREPWLTRLKRDVTEFHTLTGMKYTSIFRNAVGDPRIWDRLLAGGDIGLRKADEVYSWMAKQGHNFKS